MPRCLSHSIAGRSIYCEHRQLFWDEYRTINSSE
uniref:Uncharacterized protein n=1 Tax=Anopheles dirus TaxID=7168 RepID=A0A182NYY5_9DIPT